MLLESEKKKLCKIIENFAKSFNADDFGITKISEFDGKYVVVISLHCLLRKDAHKKVFSLEVGPLRGGGCLILSNH